MKNRRNPFASIELFVGKMKPLNGGLYSRSESKAAVKPKTKVYPEPDQYYFKKAL